ncbi:hypothetical protein OGAPHI_002225 [Ogataea philodendri]|uniref:V-SNARE coiled-coil homology domain-containing protein n=1 Tax=Ogataea philodendri TaxID=1378263 RepID=A0A9P8PB21_9ASCO|nr:uncharacterized protein OGAPHI_002225 [Ogataea philodendri]KAH3668471.1 hypothetical protein OGAPHI_002225 [Ogataea philodendri]
MSFEEELDSSVYYAALSLNSTTLYTYDNVNFTSKLNVNYSELVSKNLGVINSIQETRINSLKLSSNVILNVANSHSASPRHVFTNLMLYYHKKLMKNNNLITIIVLCNDRMLDRFVYNLMEKIMDEYLDRFYQTENGGLNFEFKNRLRDIIVDHELKLRQLTSKYGATTTDDLDEIRDLMTENIDKVLNRGENLNALINKTSQLNSSANSFRRRTVLVKRKLWWSNIKFLVLIGSTVIFIIYLFIGLECGLPFYTRCLHPSKPSQPHQNEY